MKPANGGKLAEYCEKITFFGKILFDKKFEVKIINTTKLKYILFFNYAFNIICDKISSYNKYDNIISKIENSEIKTKDKFCDFLSQIIICIWDGPKNGIPLNNILNDFDRKKIFLLQNNNFCSIDNVKMKLSYDILKNHKEEEDSIIYDLSKNQPINIDYKDQLIDKILNEKLINYSSKFGNNVLKLEEICQKIDSGIIAYDSKNFIYEQFFIDLVKKLRNYLKQVKGLGSLFPFFNERQNKLYFNCLDKEEFNRIIDIYRNYERWNIIVNINGIDDIMGLMKKFGFTDFKQLYDYFTREEGPCTVKVNGNFNFSGNKNNSNNFIIKKNFNIEPHEIVGCHNFNYNIDFEIIPKNLNDNQNLELEITIKNSNLSNEK